MKTAAAGWIPSLATILFNNPAKRVMAPASFENK